MKKIKLFEDFLSEYQNEHSIFEGNIVEKSYHFNGDLSTSSHIEARRGQYSIWINGGNAFKFEDLDKEQLAKIYDDPKMSTALEHAIMNLVVEVMDKNIDKIIADVSNPSAKE